MLDRRLEYTTRGLQVEEKGNQGGWCCNPPTPFLRLPLHSTKKRLPKLFLAHFKSWVDLLQKLSRLTFKSWGIWLVMVLRFSLPSVPLQWALHHKLSEVWMIMIMIIIRGKIMNLTSVMPMVAFLRIVMQNISALCAITWPKKTIFKNGLLPFVVSCFTLPLPKIVLLVKDFNKLKYNLNHLLFVSCIYIYILLYYKIYIIYFQPKYNTNLLWNSWVLLNCFTLP